MEQVRLILAIVLSFLIFLIWNLFFAPEPKKQPEKQSVDQAVTTAENKTTKEAAKKPMTDKATEAQEPIPSAPEPEIETAFREPARTIKIKTELYEAELSEDGGIIQRFTLLKYKATAKKDSKNKELISPENASGNFRINFENDAIPGLKNARFKTDLSTDQVSILNQSLAVTFRWRSKNGFTIDKIYNFDPNTYLIKMDVIIANQSDQTLNDPMSVSMTKLETGKISHYGFQGPCAYIDNKLEEINLKDLENIKILKGKIQWVAIQDRYFMDSIINPGNSEAQFRIQPFKDKFVSSEYVMPVGNIQPGTKQRFQLNIFMGPKSVSVLKSINYNLDQAVNFGWFDFIAKPCLWLMNHIYKYIPNYGVAIIILTFLFKILFWPLGNKSYKSMNEMKKLQPLMAQIREKYKDDKKRMNEEVMGLYKTYKINPLGGCLPMVAQIPVFFAFYRMLYGAIELRHAPFFGWITDLSAPDRLFDFSKYGISIPFMEPPDGIPVLTIIMGITMFVQQKLQPPAGDPTQAKMMMLMPLIFTVIFINFSSGLVLYWLVNNILSITQQYIVTRKKS